MLIVKVRAWVSKSGWNFNLCWNYSTNKTIKSHEDRSCLQNQPPALYLHHSPWSHINSVSLLCSTATSDLSPHLSPVQRAHSSDLSLWHTNSCVGGSEQSVGYYLPWLIDNRLQKNANRESWKKYTGHWHQKPRGTFALAPRALQTKSWQC